MKINEIILPTFSPRHYQTDWLKAFFIDHYRYMVLICHRRAGKDMFCINLCAAALQERVGTCLYLLPEQAQAKKIIWDGLDDMGNKFIDYIDKRLIKKVYKGDLLIEFKNGSLFRLGGTDKIDRHMGTNPILIVFGEYSLHKSNVFPLLSPILTANRGKAVFQFTPRSYNHAYDLYTMALGNEEWYTSKLDITQTRDHEGKPIVTEAEIQKRIKEGLDPALIKQEYYCSFEGHNTGSYYGQLLTELMETNRIYDFELDTNQPVVSVADLGVSHPTCCWLYQYYRGIYHVIYSFSQTDLGLPGYRMFLAQFAEEHGIKYLKHWAPHDIKNREWGTGKTRLEQAYELGLILEKVPSLSIDDGISAVRRFLPQCIFHKTNCKSGLDALRAYKRKWSDDRKCYMDYPNQDWSTDYADAFRYVAVSATNKIPSEHASGRIIEY